MYKKKQKIRVKKPRFTVLIKATAHFFSIIKALAFLSAPFMGAVLRHTITVAISVGGLCCLVYYAVIVPYAEVIMSRLFPETWGQWATRLLTHGRIAVAGFVISAVAVVGSAVTEIKNSTPKALATLSEEGGKVKDYLADKISKTRGYFKEKIKKYSSDNDDDDEKSSMSINSYLTPTPTNYEYL